MITTELVGREKVVDYFNKLATKYDKKTMPRIVRGELLYVLKNLSKKTKKAKLSLLKEDGRRSAYNKKDGYPVDKSISINSGKKGGRKNLAWVVLDTEKGKKFLNAGYWDGKKTIEDVQFLYLLKYQNNEANKKQKVYEDSRGSTAKTWLEASDSIVESGDSVLYRAYKEYSAKRKDGKKTNIKLLKSLRRGNYNIQGKINSGILKKSGGQYSFDMALMRRNNFYKNALKKGLLDDARFLSRYAPFILTKNTSLTVPQT